MSEPVNVPFDGLIIERLPDGIRVRYFKDGGALAHFEHNVEVGEGLYLHISGTFEATIT